MSVPNEPESNERLRVARVIRITGAYRRYAWLAGVFGAAGAFGYLWWTGPALVPLLIEPPAMFVVMFVAFRLSATWSRKLLMPGVDGPQPPRREE